MIEPADEGGRFRFVKPPKGRELFIPKRSTDPERIRATLQVAREWRDATVVPTRPVATDLDTYPD